MQVFATPVARYAARANVRAVHMAHAARDNRSEHAANAALAHAAAMQRNPRIDNRAPLPRPVRMPARRVLCTVAALAFGVATMGAAMAGATCPASIAAAAFLFAALGALAD